MPNGLIDLATPVEKAFIVAVDTGGDDGWTAEDSLAELANLALTAGADVVGAGTFAQRIAESMKSQGSLASEGRGDEGEEVAPPREKKGNPRRLKKADRRLRLRLEKL